MKVLDRLDDQRYLGPDLFDIILIRCVDLFYTRKEGIAFIITNPFKKMQDISRLIIS